MTGTISISAEDKGKRIDIFLSKKLNLTRSYIQKLIKQGFVRINSNTAKANKILKEKDILSVDIPEQEENRLKPVNIKLDILYEDKDLIIINKPAGLTVHPAPSVKGNTLVNALLHHTKSLSTIGGELRPGIIHRLDKDTSGLLIVAKTNKAHLKLIEDMKERKIVRKYIVLVKGEIRDKKGEIRTFIGRNLKDRKKYSVVTKGGKSAVTKYEAIKILKGYSLLKVELLTGRTHQIRVHMKYIGYPVIGDKVYGISEKNNIICRMNRQALHAYSLSFNHPITKKKMKFVSSIPDDIKCVLKDMLRQKHN